jgi:DNA-binding winged helix-turn-helix (wHTH) protein
MKQDELAEELFGTLEQCGERLRAIREEVDSSIALVNVAMSTVTHMRASPALRHQLAELLEAQRRDILRDVAALLKSGGEPPSGPFRFSLDPMQRSAQIGRRRIPLTKAEFRLLECLWERRPRPASRQDLLDHLYGDGEQPTDAVIDVIIFKIRHKLKNAGCDDASIEVVRGEGWFLNLEPAAGRVEGKKAAVADAD